MTWSSVLLLMAWATAVVFLVMALLIAISDRVTVAAGFLAVAFGALALIFWSLS